MKIDHINIVIDDLNAAKEVFLELCFEVVTQGELKGEWIDKIVSLVDVRAEYVAISFPGHETKLELLKYNKPTGEKDPKIGMANQIGYRHIALEVENIEKVVEKLK